MSDCMASSEFQPTDVNLRKCVCLPVCVDSKFTGAPEYTDVTTSGASCSVVLFGKNLHSNAACFHAQKYGSEFCFCYFLSCSFQARPLNCEMRLLASSSIILIYIYSA
jgi:hypothetical protein